MPWVIEPGPYYLEMDADEVALYHKVSGSIMADMQSVRPVTPPAPPEPKPFWQQQFLLAMNEEKLKKMKEPKRRQGRRARKHAKMW